MKWFAVFGVISFLFFVTLLKSAGVLGMLAVAGFYMLTLSSDDLLRAARQAPLLAYPFLAMLSSAWSEAPLVTLRLGTQLLVTGAIALVLYRTVPFRIFMSAMLSAGIVACLVSFAIQPGALTGADEFLRGIAGSKNAMAYIASASVICSVAIIVDPGFSLRMRGVAVGGVLLTLLALVLAKSAGALLGTVVGCALVVAVRAFVASPATVRALILLALLLITPVIAFSAPLLAEQSNEFAQDVLAKDTTTLTGRTYLWQRAGEYIAEKPISGHGFGAFWREGSVEAEGLWRAYAITNRGGFNFHNQFYEALMDIGYMGLVVLIAILAVSALSLALRTARGGSAETPFYVGMFVSLAMRVSVESALLTQFTSATLIFFMATAAAVYGPEAKQAFARSQGPRLRRTLEDKGLVRQREKAVVGRKKRTLIQARQEKTTRNRAVARIKTKRVGRRNSLRQQKPRPDQPKS